MTTFEPSAFLLCGHCEEVVDPRLSWQSHSNGVHLRADCSQCDRWIKYVQQYDEDGEPSVWRRLIGEPK